MKRLLNGFLLFYLLISVHLPIVRAQDAKLEMMPDFSGGGSSLPFGQENYYSVTLRGNGEAVVIGKYIFTNNENTSQSTFSLRFPGVNPQNILAFQIIKDPICIRYDSKSVDNPRIQVIPGYPIPNCLEYQPISFNQYNYGPAKYQKAKTILNTDTLSVFLPSPVRPNDSGSLILYYRGQGYAQKNLWGAWQAAFETPKLSDQINKLVVGVTVDDDLKLAGAKGQVSYRFSESMMAPMAKMAEGVTTSNQYMDSYLYQIGQGQIVKTASNLAALDSYIVRVRYATNFWSLYARELAIGLLIGLALVAGLVFMAKSVFSRINHASRSAISRPGIEITAAIGLPFISALLTVVFTTFLFFSQQLLNQLISYDLRFFVLIFSLLIAIGVYALLLLSPAVYLGLKRGISWGLITFGLTIFWLTAFGVIALILLFLAARRDYPISPQYMMESTNLQTLPPSTTAK